MRYVFANWCTGLNQYDRKEFFDRSSKIPVKSILVSVVHPIEIKIGLDYCRRIKNEVDIWIDSGAFTVWNTGGSISAKWYSRQIDLLKPLLKDFKNVHFVSLDSIPGHKGRLVTKEELKEATMKSIENAEYLFKQGHKVIPVHHQGEDVSVFKHYLSMTDYVGVSPANDRSIKSRVEYVKSLLPCIKGSINNPPACHSFGNVSKKVVESFPFYSVDSASWKASVYFGGDYQLMNFKKETGQRKFVSTRSKSQKASVLFENVKQTLDYENDMTRVWDIRGVKPKEPIRDL